MDAKVGDRIVVDGRSVDDPRREGEILEVKGEGDLHHYVVRWADGHESTFFPGSTTHVLHPS
jgi:hypothetical protein